MLFDPEKFTKWFLRAWFVWAIFCVGVGGTFLFLIAKALLKYIDG